MSDERRKPIPPVRQNRITDSASVNWNELSGGSGAPATETFARTRAPTTRGEFASRKRPMLSSSSPLSSRPYQSG